MEGPFAETRGSQSPAPFGVGDRSSGLGHAPRLPRRRLGAIPAEQYVIPPWASPSKTHPFHWTTTCGATRDNARRRRQPPPRVVPHHHRHPAPSATVDRTPVPAPATTGRRKGRDATNKAHADCARAQVALPRGERGRGGGRAQHLTTVRQPHQRTTHQRSQAKGHKAMQPTPVKKIAKG